MQVEAEGDSAEDMGDCSTGGTRQVTSAVQDAGGGADVHVQRDPQWE